MTTQEAIDASGNGDPSQLSVGRRLRFLARDVVLYGGAGAFNQAFALITFPLLARHFSVEDYGRIDFFTVLASLLTVVFIFGQDSAVARFFYEHNETDTRRQVISQSFAIQVGTLLVGLPLLWAVSGPLADRISDAAQGTMLLRLVLLQIPFLVMINFSQNILKWTFSRARFLTVSIGSTVFSVAALLVGIYMLDLGLIGVFNIFLATRVVFGCLGMWFVRSWLTWPREWRIGREMLPFALPYGVISTIGMFMPAMQRGFIVDLLGDRELGLFAAGAKVAMLVSLPIQAVQVAWGPFSLAIFKEANAAQTYNWVLKSFAIGVFALVLTITALADPILRVLASRQYDGAAVVVFAMSLGLAFQGIGWISTVGISLSKRSHLQFYPYLVFVLVSMLAMYTLLQVMGLPGVAWGGMIGYAARTVTETWIAQRAFPLDWSFGGVFGLAVFVLIVGGLSQVATLQLGALAGSLLAVLGLLATVFFGWRVVFTASERSRIITGARSVLAGGRT